MPSGDRVHCRAGATQLEVDRYWEQSIARAQPNGAPAYVEVELGINDAVWHTSAQLVDYERRIRQFLSWLPAGVPVLWDNIPAMAPVASPGADTNYRVVNAALAAVATTNPALHIVDLRASFAGHWPAWFQADRLHYNAKGQYEFALVNCNALRALQDPSSPDRSPC
jgi:lysophospholipase L1-like esterase